MRTFIRCRELPTLVLAVGCSLITLGQAVFVPYCVMAQTGSASISGRVTDQSNAVVPEVEVEIKNVDTNATQVTKTNGDGIYSFPALPPGNYLMNVRREQFRTVSVTGIELHTQDSLARNFILQVGSSAESVTVSANAEHMPTDNPAVGLLVDRTFVENMPLNGRSFQDLISLAPGTVSSNLAAQTGNGQTSGLFSINGQRDDANYFTVDGISSNTGLGSAGDVGDPRAQAGVYPAQTVLGTTQSLISLDALQEFKIQTSTYDAEFGRQPGGQIQLTTRSGSNELHGSLFDYFRNDVFDANSWLLNFFGIPKPAERQNDFGGTVGGPLKIPGLYDGKDKTFYFFSYEGLRLDQPADGSTNVPSLALRQFAAAGLQPFFNSLPLVTGHDNGDQCLLALGQTFSCTALWVTGFSAPSSINSVSFRMDESLGEKVHLFGRYGGTPSNQTQLSSGGAQSTETKSNAYAGTVGATIRFGSTLTNDLRFNYTYTDIAVMANPVAVGGGVPYSESLLAPPAYSNTGANTFTFFTTFIPGAHPFAIPVYQTSRGQQHQLNLLDSFTWTHGKHDFGAGLDYRRLSPFNPHTFQFGVAVLSPLAVQQGFADRLFVSQLRASNPLFNNWSLYIQDHWKLTARLTLDGGLRWELNPSPGAADGIYPLALTSGNIAVATLAPNGTPQYHTRYDQFAPRLGFAYQTNGSEDHQIVVRGGFGIFYDTGQALGAAGYSSYPFFARVTSPDVPFPLMGASIVPPPLNSPLIPPYGELAGVSDPNLRLPYTEEWSLSTDLGITSKNVMSVSYLGNAGHRQLFTALYGSSGTPYPPNPLFTQLYLTNNLGSSNYNALQLQDQGKIGSRADVVLSYTWSHAIDNASTDFSLLAPLRGNGDADVRQVLNGAVYYTIPGAHQNRALRAVTEGWSISGRVMVQSGNPIDVIQGQYVLSNGVTGNIRPDLVSGVPIYLHNVSGVPGGWELNYAAFNFVPTDPNTGAPLRQGTLGRNFVHGPNFWNINTAVQRNFPLRDRLRLAFRVDAFNLLNHANVNSIDPNLADGPGFFGTGLGVQTTGPSDSSLYASGSARSLQFMLKLEF